MSREGAAKMQSYEVIFYDLEDGTEPAKEFLLSLDVKMRAKMLRTIDLLAVNGVELREPHSKPLDDGIFELRAKVGSDRTRVVYFFMVGKRQENSKDAACGDCAGETLSGRVPRQEGRAA